MVEDCCATFVNIVFGGSLGIIACAITHTAWEHLTRWYWWRRWRKRGGWVAIDARAPWYRVRKHRSTK